jgi:predicted aconitase
MAPRSTISEGPPNERNHMNSNENHASSDTLRWLGAAMVGLSAFAMTACDTDNTADSAEDVGEAIDDAADDASDAVDDAADNIDDAVDDATDGQP